MNNIMEIGTCVVELAIMFFYLNNVLSKKKEIGCRIWFMYIGIFVINVARSYLYLPMNTNIIITFVLWFAAAYIGFEGTLLKKLFFVAIEIMLVLLSDMLTSVFLTMFGNIDYSDAMTLRHIGMIVTNAFLFVTSAYVAQFAKKNYRHLPVKFNVLMVLCPMSSIFILLFLDLCMIEMNKIYYVPTIMMLVVLGYINVMIFNFFDYYQKGIKVTAMDALLEANEENYKLLEENEKNLHILRHDIANHMAGIREMMNQDDKSAVEMYVDELDKTIAGINSISRSGNITLDTVLNVEGRKAMKEGIKYDVVLNIDADISIQPLDLCTILYNAIDNAIEACEHIEDKYILVSVSADEKKLRINIENTSPEVEVNDNSVKSKKEDKAIHGYGIKSIKEAVDKYNGLVSFSYEEKRFVCRVSIDNRIGEER